MTAIVALAVMNAMHVKAGSTGKSLNEIIFIPSPGQEVPGSIPAVAAGSLLVGSVSV